MKISLNETGGFLLENDCREDYCVKIERGS